MEKRFKDVTVSFFITGQSDKSKPINTPTLLDNVWKNHFISKPNKALATQRLIGEKKYKNLVLNIIENDISNNTYFGYVGVFRDSILPSLFNKTLNNDANIKVGKDDEVLEKSYFIYHANIDLLVFHQNHLGAVTDDLAFLLFTHNDKTQVFFEPIWKDADLKKLLEKGSILKSGTLTLALPRNFKQSTLNLSNSWSNSIIDMMSSAGMSRMSLSFSGRASGKKGVIGYLSDEIKEGLRELLNKHGTAYSSSPQLVKKAEAKMTNGTKESLLNQELKTKLEIEVVNGYPVHSNIKKVLLNAKAKCEPTLAQYYISNRT